jgi:hypothetical protein
LLLRPVSFATNVLTKVSPHRSLSLYSYAGRKWFYVRNFLA